MLFENIDFKTFIFFSWIKRYFMGKIFCHILRFTRLNAISNRFNRLYDTIRTIQAQPIWGIVADKLRNRKAVYLFTTTLNTASILTLSIPEVSDAYWKIIAVASITASFVAGGILDAYALETLKEVGKVSDYGKLRLWTAISWGGGTSVMGFVIDRYGFSMMFIIFGS